MIPLNNNELKKHRHGKTMAWVFTHLLAKSGGSQPPPSKTPVNTALNNGLRISHICWQHLAEVSRDRAKGHAQLTFARLFASRCVKSLALVFMRHQQAFCSMAAHFRQILPADVRNTYSPCFDAIFTGFLLGHSSLPPDFARGFVQSRALAFTRYVHFFCSVTASRLPPDFARGFV